MKEPIHSEEFLSAATAGLQNDRELQLDVQAELRSHLEGRRRDAEAAGLAPDAAADEAVRAMGPAAALAADLERANRRRMRLRALVKMAAQWLLAPLAVVVAVLTTDWGAFHALRLLNALGGASDSVFISPKLGVRRGLTPDQRLVLYGDVTHPLAIEQQRAIWERWPASKVYLHNYVTFLIGRDWERGGTPEEKYATLAAEVAKLQPLDPRNARFDYLLAGRLLDQAVETTPRDVKVPDGKPKTEYDTVIKDRAKLDAAMAHLKAGLAKPEFRRYTREMSVERLAIMGEPTSLLQEIAEIGVLAGILLPDLAHLRNLERTAVFYGELLANESRREEAELFLNAHRHLVPQINRDSFTLIDVLVVGAIAGIAADRVPAVYEKLGDTAAAERARVETTALAAPIKQWRENRQAADKNPAGDAWAKEWKRHGGILAGILFPALGEYPTPAELAPGRHLEYVVAEGLALSLLSVALTVTMLALVLQTLYYRWVRGGGADTLLLLPDGGDILRILGYGVLVPLLLYYGITRCLPWGGRNLSLFYGSLQFIVHLWAMVCAIGMVTRVLADRCVRRRCRELLLPVPLPPPAHWSRRIAEWSILGAAVLLAVLPEAWLRLDAPFAAPLLIVGAVFLMPLGFGAIGYCIRRDRLFGKACAAYYGSLARTLIPVVALTLILVNLASRPYLRMEERRLLRSDSVMRVDPNGGFTAVESRVTQRLKAEIEKAVSDAGL